MRKNLYRLILIAVAVASTILVIGSGRTSSKSQPCEETMEECCRKKQKGGDTMIWETLSGQFFTSSGLN